MMPTGESAAKAADQPPAKLSHSGAAIPGPAPDRAVDPSKSLKGIPDRKDADSRIQAAKSGAPRAITPRPPADLWASESGQSWPSCSGSYRFVLINPRPAQ